MAMRVVVCCLALGLGAVACEDKTSDDKSSDDDDAKSDKGDKDKKKKKKKDKDGDGDGDGDGSGKGKGDGSGKGDGDDKGAVAEPKSEAPKTAVAEPAPAPAPPPEPAPPPAPACGPPDKVPAIPAERSDAPASLEEWKAACPVNTQGPNSHAPDCTSMVLREWLKVTCTGKMLGFEEMDGFGVEGQDYFKLFTPNQALSFVVRLRKGQSQKVRMCRPNQRASLFVSWPPSKEQPTIIAVGIGPKCERY